MHAKAEDAQLPDGHIRVLLAPIPKLSVKAGHLTGEVRGTGFRQAKIVNVVVRAAQARPLGTFSRIITQLVRNNQKIPPVKRHSAESRNRTPTPRRSDGSFLTTTPYQRHVL